MATTTGIIRVYVQAYAEGIRDLANDAERELKRIQSATDGLNKGLSSIAGSGVKAVFGLGAIGNAATGIAAVAGSATTAAGALLVLPAAGLAAAAAIGTLKIATSGFGDAVSAADPAAFAEATKDMAPAAREGAAALRDLVQGPLKDLKRDVQGAFFAGFAQDVNDLGGRYVPILRTGLVGIATAYAGMRQNAVDALLQPRSVAAVNTVLGDTTKILGDMRPALGNVLAGVLAIAGQGSAGFRDFGLSVTDATERFKDWARAAADSGRITEMIAEGKQELRDYGTIAGNVGDILGAVFEGLSQGGLDFSASLVESTQALEDFLESAQGQDALQALGEVLATTAEVTREVFLTAMRELGPVIIAAAPAVERFATVLGALLVEAIETVAPLLEGFAAFVSDNAGAIDILVPALGALVVGFGALKVITSITTLISGFSTVVGGLSFLISPLGIALGVVAGAMFLFAQRNGESAAAARENQQAVEGLKGTLNQLTGAVTGATTAQIAQGLSGEKLADGTTNMRDAIARAGISFTDFTAAATGNEAAIARVDAQLAKVALTLPGVNQLYDENSYLLQQGGVSMEEFAGYVARGDAGFRDFTETMNEAGVATTIFKEDFAEAGGELTEVGGRFEELRGQVKEAGEQVRVAAQAGTDFTTTLEAIKAGLSGLEEGAEPTKLLTDNLTALGLSAQGAAEEARKAGEAAGANLAGQAKQGADSMAESRAAFLAAADAAGIGAEQANAMANSIGLIPEAKRLEILTNAEGVNAELIGIQEQIKAVPPNTTITVNSLTEEAFAKLQELGFEVTRLNDGRVEIVTGANTDPARVAFGDLMTTITGTTGTFDLDANPDPATGVINATVELADGSTGIVTIDANGNPATVVLDGVKYRIDATTGVLTIDGNEKPADAKRAGQKVKIDQTTGTLKIDANTAGADGKINGLYAKWNGRTIQLNVSTAGRLAGGGIVAGAAALGMAGGGFVVPGYGPGRDTFGPVWLSPGEAVLTPEAAARYGYRNILRDNYRFSGGRMGQVLGPGAAGLGLAGGGIAGRDYLADLPAARAGGGTSITVPAPVVVNHFYVDGQEFRGMVQTEIQADQRATARRVRAGSGASF